MTKTTVLCHIKRILEEDIESLDICKNKLKELFPKDKQDDAVSTCMAIQSDSAALRINTAIVELATAYQQVVSLHQNINLAEEC